MPRQEKEDRYPQKTNEQRETLREFWECFKRGNLTIAQAEEKVGKPPTWIYQVRKTKPWLFEELGIPLNLKLLEEAVNEEPPARRTYTKRASLAPVAAPVRLPYQRVELQIPNDEQRNNETLVVLMGRPQDVTASLDAIARIYGR